MEYTFSAKATLKYSADVIVVGGGLAVAPLLLPLPETALIPCLLNQRVWLAVLRLWATFYPLTLQQSEMASLLAEL